MPRVLQTICVLFAGLMGAPSLQAAPELDLPPAFIEQHTDRITHLFESLDLSRPGLSKVREAYQQGDLEAASEALLIYYAEREKGSPLPEPEFPSPNLMHKANQLLDDVFLLQDVEGQQPRLPNGGLDWEDQGPRDDPEWAWFLNRHVYFNILLRAWRETGDAIYLQTLSNHIVDWISHNPYPDRLTFSSAWRALETARRILDSWTFIFFELQNEPAFTPEARLLLLSSVPEHADNLREHASFWGGNHLLTEKTALLAIAVAWPEFRQSPEWRDYAVTKTRAEILKQTYPDGAFKELTNHYQRVVLLNLQIFIDLVLKAENLTPDPALIQRAEAMWDFFVASARPNGTGPLNSASDLEYSHIIAREAKVVGSYQREDWRYMLTNGEEGTKPQRPASRFYSWAGHAVMRDGWNAQSNWAFFDMGPHGTAHQHFDRLHLSLSVHGQDFLVDSGRYTYQPGPMRDYFKGSRGHNILLVDGEGALPPPLEVDTPLPVTAEITEAYDFFAATEHFPGSGIEGRNGPQHTRAVFYDKVREFWVVIDEVIAFGPTPVEFLWHFHPEVELQQAAPSAWKATRQDQTLQARLLTPQASLTADTDGGWYSATFNEKRTAPLLHLQILMSGPQIFVWYFGTRTEAQVPEVEIEGRTVRIGEHLIDLRGMQLQPASLAESRE